jgi:hypothetical protein
MSALYRKPRFGEGDRAGVFHRAVQEVRHQQLVVLLELVRNAEVLVEEGQAGLGVLEPVGRLDLRRHRLAREQAHRVLAAGVFPDLVRAGVHREVVRAEFFRAREGPALAVGRASTLVSRLVDTTTQSAGAVTVTCVGGLQVGLVEHREHLVRGGRLEVRVGVDAAVDRVDHAVQAFAVGAVQALVAHDDGVAALDQVLAASVMNHCCTAA